jgi:uncharacterized protein YndB with AHSA1/START domain
VAELRKEIWIDAPPETVFPFLVERELATAWMGDESWNDPRPGGVFRLDIHGHVASGEFVELDPPRRLVYSWGWEPGEDGPNPVPPGSSTVEIELVPNGAGTTLRFNHRGLPSTEAAESHAHGWDHYLERLIIAAPGGDAGPDPWISGEM